MPILFSLIFGSTALVVIAAPTQQRGKQQSPQAIDWNATAADHQRQIDQDFSYRCLSDGRVGTVWGTDTYTNDSGATLLGRRRIEFKQVLQESEG